MRKLLLLLMLIGLFALLPLAYASYNIGYTAIGVTPTGGTATFTKVEVAVPSGYMANITSISAYLSNSSANTYAQIGIYDASYHLAAASNQFLINGAAWYTETVSATLLNGTYFLAVSLANASGSALYFNSIAGFDTDSQVIYPLPINAAPGHSGTYAISVYATFNYANLVNSTVTADTTVWFLIIFIFLTVALSVFPRVPLLNFLVGIVGVSFIALSFENTNLPFWPWSPVLLALVSVICMLSGGFKMRSG